MLFFILFSLFSFSSDYQKDIMGVWEIKSQTVFLNGDIENAVIINSKVNSDKLLSNYLMEFQENSKFIKLHRNGSSSELTYHIDGNYIILFMKNDSLKISYDYQGRYTYLYYKIDFDGDGNLDFVVEKLQRNYSTGNWSMNMMNKYKFVMLVKGNNRNHSKEEAQKIQEGHMKNINKMAEEGILYIAGPFLEDANERGIFIFKDIDDEIIKSKLNDDPAIREGRLAYILLPWMTEAGAVLPIDK